jgi:dipeptidyl aminopeptidase/acylaminoacyl peptidase
MEFNNLPLPITDVSWDGIDRLSDSSFLLVGGGATSAQLLCKVDITSDGANETVVRQSSEQQFPESLFSLPEHIEFPAKKGPKRTVHGFFWPPHNPQYQGPDGQKAPLIVLPHGGPTAHTSPGLALRFQYWSSRGYALFAINYTGSSGHGRDYRDLLNGNWGVIDVDDVAESVQYLAETGRVDGSKVGIKGGSAGGYSVLQALCCYPEIFAGGVCLYGISEVKLLLEETHKMESRYGDMLIFTDDMTEKDREKVMYDRSPLHHAGNITAPLLMLHGEEDKVVPISQAYVMYDKIKERGGEVKLIKFPGEGHGFSKGENRLKSMHEEEEWWKKTLVIKP